MKNIAVFGSTGSIGTQTLRVAEHLGLNVTALTANKNYKLIEAQARKFKPDIVAMKNEIAARNVKIALRDMNVKVLSGEKGIVEAVGLSNADMAVQAIVGIDGLYSTLEMIRCGIDIGLANKETLVCAGELIMSEATKKGVKILPIDSEHSAIFQCIQDRNSAKALDKILLTASGGPFFGLSFEQLENVTVRDAMRHPNWNMGAKITVDSATMMNKGLEMIEAMRLYNVEANQIDILVHRESVVHSAVQFADGAVIAQMSVPDMKLPIQYALTYPKRLNSCINPLDLTKIGNLTFFKPDEDAFPCLGLARKAAENGNGMTVALNGANEAAVELFLNGQIGFNDIYRTVENVLGNFKDVINPSLMQIIEIDRDSRSQVKEQIKVR